MNFNIIDGEDEFQSKYDRFVELYNNGLQVNKIKEELNINNTYYQKLRKQALEEELITARIKVKKGKYYTKTSNGKYIIIKRLNGEMKSFGVYDNLNECKAKIEHLKSKGWVAD